MFKTREGTAWRWQYILTAASTKRLEGRLGTL